MFNAHDHNRKEIMLMPIDCEDTSCSRLHCMINDIKPNLLSCVKQNKSDKKKTNLDVVLESTHHVSNDHDRPIILDIYVLLETNFL